MISFSNTILKKVNIFFYNISNIKQKHLFIILFLILLCFYSRIINFVGIGTNDDLSYIYNGGMAMAEGYNPLKTNITQIGCRIGMVFPLALIHKFFGLNENAISFFPPRKHTFLRQNISKKLL